MNRLRDLPRGVWLMLIATCGSAIANSMLATVLGLQVFAITAREFDLGMIGLAEFLPVLLLSPFTGTLADRFDRRLIYATGILISGLATLGLLIHSASSQMQVAPMLLLVSLHGASRSLGTPASRALMIDLVPRPLLQRTIALRSLLFQISLVVGPIIGALANRHSFTLPYMIVLGLLGLSITTLLGIPRQNVQRLETRPGPAQAIRDAIGGLQFIRQSPIVFGGITLDLFAVLFGGAVALLPAIVEKRLDFADVDLGVGILRAAIAAGAAVMALILAFRPLTRHIGHWLFAVIAFFGLGTIVLGLTHSFVAAVITIAAISAADQISVFIRATLVPLATPESMRGRVFAVENIFIGGSNQLGAFESGITAAWFGLAPAVVFGGAATLAVVGISWFAFPELRRVDRMSEVKPHQDAS